jgi:hypothetical protein
MIRMKTHNAVFATTDFTYSLAGFVKWIQLKGADGTDVEVIGNFDVNARTQDVYFPSAGSWYDNLTGKSIEVPSVPFNMTLAPGEYHVFSNKALTQ